MLAECLTFLTTPCPRPLRRLGYLGQVIGTQSRFRRCRSAWAPHLENCRQAILEAARSVADHRKATVLGSGLLLDVPLAELAATFEEVALVDVLHMRSARRAAARFPNVRLVEADVSGVIARLADPSGTPPSLDLPEGDADFVVSANLLTQLPYLPCRWLRRRKVISPDGIDAFGRALMRQHLQSLARLAGRVCLITEVEHRLCDGPDTVQTFDPLRGLKIGLPTREWLWDIAPRPEIHRRYDVRFRVVATAGMAAG
ncbi:hypothetical protein [Shumkonia mesophila]|uniref:hypothetical protein n=1 Tax=Shumkonia mesophila TaxID=2838854 RepID=UPI0029351991|nr:hypothetical protein [Shumkonia mesophila]